jgi:hypothetical protein
MPFAKISTLRLALAASPALLLVVSCGSEKSKDEQANEFYAEKLHSADEKACNDKGFMYDNLEAKCLESADQTVKLATWSCTRDGLAAHLAERDPAKAAADTDQEALASVDAEIADGYELHQCGDDAAGITYLVLIKKGKTSKEATLEIKHAAVVPPPKPFLRLVPSTDDAKVDACVAYTIENTVAGSGSSSAGKANVASDVQITLKLDANAASASKASLYTDEGCKTAGAASGTTITMKAGTNAATYWFKATEVDAHTVDASAPGYDPVSSLLISVIAAP